MILTLEPDMLYRYIGFINERHMIYMKKKTGWKYPWTEDPILCEYKFTNIFRELDRGTIWYAENIREPYKDHPELFFHTCAYRMINYYPTYEDILKQLGFFNDFSATAFSKVMRDRKACGLKVFTGAHLLTGTLGGDKINQVVNVGLQSIWDSRHEVEPQEGDTLEKAFNRLMQGKLYGMGPFIAYEIITDLRHTRYLKGASDIKLWANPGPGAKRGIERLCKVFWHKSDGTSKPKISKSNRPTDKDYIDVMRWLQHYCNEKNGMHVPTMEMRDVEHSLCEFDKYERARLGQGRPRQKYRVSDETW